MTIVQDCEKRGGRLRIIGAMAVKLHCPRYSTLLDILKREPTDIDFMSHSKDRDKVIKMFQEMGYAQNRNIDFLYGGQRQIFRNESKQMTADVFFDELRMAHTVRFTDRLDADYPTIALADLVLEKLQIVKINEKDVIDLMVIFREHELGATENETINSSYIAKLLSDDWGFYYTATTNLKKIRDTFISRYAVLKEDDVGDIRSKINYLLEEIDRKDKSLRWKMRAKIGTKQKWYYDVEDAAR